MLSRSLANGSGAGARPFRFVRCKGATPPRSSRAVSRSAHPSPVECAPAPPSAVRGRGRTVVLRRKHGAPWYLPVRPPRRRPARTQPDAHAGACGRRPSGGRRALHAVRHILGRDARVRPQRLRSARVRCASHTVSTRPRCSTQPAARGRTAARATAAPRRGCALAAAVRRACTRRCGRRHARSAASRAHSITRQLLGGAASAHEARGAG